MTDQDSANTHVEEHSVKEKPSTIEVTIESSVRHRTSVSEESSVLDNIAVITNKSVKATVAKKMLLKDNTAEVTNKNSVIDNRPVTEENTIKERTKTTVTFASTDVRLRQFGQSVQSQSSSHRQVIIITLYI